jgi:hypothetical protein
MRREKRRGIHVDVYGIEILDLHLEGCHWKLQRCYRYVTNAGSSMSDSDYSAFPCNWDI